MLHADGKDRLIMFVFNKCIFEALSCYVMFLRNNILLQSMIITQYANTHKARSRFNLELDLLRIFNNTANANYFCLLLYFNVQ